MLMTAVELIEANPNPSRDDIREAVGGILCRCTGYQTIVEAVELAAQRLAAARPFATPKEAAK
jgi:carbon-monoxide dehydrogenase small subunit